VVAQPPSESLATVDLADGQRTVKGRAAKGEERSGLWNRCWEFDKNLGAYAARRSAETAVVILEQWPTDEPLANDTGAEAENPWAAPHITPRGT
jgi:hypothetical protein